MSVYIGPVPAIALAKRHLQESHDKLYESRPDVSALQAIAYVLLEIEDHLRKLEDRR